MFRIHRLQASARFRNSGRRTKLAEQATNGANEAFNRNITNRLWAHMFGRGLVYPADMQHPDNPPPFQNYSINYRLASPR